MVWLVFGRVFGPLLFLANEVHPCIMNQLKLTSVIISVVILYSAGSIAGLVKVVQMMKTDKVCVTPQHTTANVNDMLVVGSYLVYLQIFISRTIDTISLFLLFRDQCNAYKLKFSLLYNIFLCFYTLLE